MCLVLAMYVSGEQGNSKQYKWMSTEEWKYDMKFLQAS